MKIEIQLGDAPLTLRTLEKVAVEGWKVALGDSAKKRIQKGYEFLCAKVQTGETFYGINTGFGLLSNVRIADKDLSQLQKNILRSHAVGMGQRLSEQAVRMMLLLRANNLVHGHSGVKIETVQRLLDFLNQGIYPVIPEQGSVGASGDLAPLSHLALPLIGEGLVTFRGSSEIYDGAEIKIRFGLAPIELGPKEGLALINGTQFMTALGALACIEAKYLFSTADVTGALSLEAMKGTADAFHPNIQNIRPHYGQKVVAAHLRSLLNAEKGGTEISRSHADCGKVQDPYSSRCMPQVHGASRDVLRYVTRVIETEANAVTDNPLLFPDEDLILSGGNFHGQPVAMALDFLAIAAAEIASISETRIEKLINPSFSDLPAFLAKNGGLNSGFMIVQVAAAAIVSENKTLCHPASVDSIPTSADKEDHVSMGAWGAVKLTRILNNIRRVLAMELMMGCQGLDFHAPLKTSENLEKVRTLVRSRVAFAEEDRFFHPDLVALEEMLKNHEIPNFE